MLDKYENSYKYIEEFFNIYPLHQLDKEHLANIKELIGKVKQLEEENKQLIIEKNATIKLMELMALSGKDGDIVESALILDKYKNAIEIFKKHISVEREGSYMFFDYQDNDLTQQEYELLKEVLNE